MSLMVNIPAIRFEKFSSSYKQYKLGEITNSVSRPIKMEDEEDYNLVTVKRRNEGIVDRGIFKGREVKVKNQYKIEVGDFLISKRQIIHGACEIVPKNLDGAIVSNEYHILHGKKNLLLTEYLNLLSTLPKIKNYFALACVGVDIEKMLFRIEDWKKRSVMIPSIDEQQKIALFFKLLNQKIEKQQEKIEKLEELKKGLMLKIFSQELKFKDEWDKEFPNWEMKTIGDIAISLDNLRKPLNSQERIGMKGNIPYYGANGIVDYINQFIFNEDLILLAEDGGQFEEFANRPIAQYITGESWVNNHAHVLKASKCDSKYLYYQLVHKDIRKYINGSSRSKLNKESMLRIEVKVPKSMEEQKKIADFLSKFDLKLEKEELYLQYLKKQKKGFMQQMFI